MKIIVTSISALILSGMIASSASVAGPAAARAQARIWLDQNVDPGASTISVKPTCDAGGSIIPNCIDDGLYLNVWLDEIRKPGIDNPVRVDIDPGNYDSMYIKMECDPANDYTGYVSFVGSGAEVTVFSMNSNPIVSKQCTNLEFSDFAVKTGYHYINWYGGGTSRWNNMEIMTAGASWREHDCAAERGSHYWYSSKLAFGSVGTDLGYSAHCDESWFYGSEIKLGQDFYSHHLGHAIAAFGAGEIHVYGGNIGGIGVPGSNSGLIRAVNGGKVHIHGTGIDLVPSASATGVSNIFKAESGGTIHANSNAYAVDFSTNATISRINESGGSVIAPYNWGALMDPPPVVSKTGSDMVVETDCSASVCDDAGSMPHMLIYDASCSANAGGPWMDSVSQACRGE